jgi:hypothetical protein
LLFRLVALVLVGYVVALPVLFWHRRDLLGFRRMLWVGYGSRSDRLSGALIFFLAGGWPEVVVAFGWRVSDKRKALIAERDYFRYERDSGDATGSP